MLHLHLTDNEYPFTGFTHTRLVARAILLNEQNKIALHTLHRDDIFGNQTYLETPGGGVDEGETFEEAVKRECLEETGADIQVICPLGEVEDAYNLIGRKNINRFYLCRILSQKEKHFVSEGDGFIQHTDFYSIDEAISAYRKQEDHGVAGLVKRRELPLLLEAKNYLEIKITH